MNNDVLQEVYDKFLDITKDMCEEYSPLSVAGIMVAQALSIYKTVLSPTEFDKIVDTVSESRSEVKPFNGATLQ
jgi:hypothetical protein